MGEKTLDKKRIEKKVKRFLETDSSEKRFKYLVDLCGMQKNDKKFYLILFSTSLLPRFVRITS
jgi:hypothetical protein